MGLPHYKLAEWLADWDWWSSHVAPTLLQTPTKELQEETERYFAARYADDPKWRHSRMSDAWRFFVDNLEKFIAENVVTAGEDSTLNVHQELPTVLWLYFNDVESSKAIKRATFTPTILQEYGRSIRETLLSN